MESEMVETKRTLCETRKGRNRGKTWDSDPVREKGNLPGAPLLVRVGVSLVARECRVGTESLQLLHSNTRLLVTLPWSKATRL